MELCQKLSAAFAQEEITSLNFEDLISVSFIVRFFRVKCGNETCYRYMRFFL